MPLKEIVPPRSFRTYDQLHSAVIARLEVDLPLPMNDMIEQDEQRVAMAVQALLKLSPEYWSRLCHAERKPWLEQVLALQWQEKQRTNRTGRPRKGESDKEQLVIGALVRHHCYQPGGSITNYEPAKTSQLSALASNEHVQVSGATVSRFFKRKFTNPNCLGHKGYAAACNRDASVNIGQLLALWQGEFSEQHLAALRPDDGARND